MYIEKNEKKNLSVRFEKKNTGSELLHFKLLKMLEAKKKKPVI